VCHRAVAGTGRWLRVIGRTRDQRMADDEADHGLVVISGRLIAIIAAVLLLLLVVVPLRDPASRPRHQFPDGQLEFPGPVDGGPDPPEQVLTSKAEVARHPFGTH